MELESLKLAKNETPVSKHLPITHFNEPTIFECRNGQIGCTLKVKGVPFHPVNNDELNHYKRVKHHAVCLLGEEFYIIEHTFRRKLDIHLDGEFAEPFTKKVNDTYHKQFKDTQLYANELYITILYKGIDSGLFGKLINGFQTLFNKAVKQAREEYRLKTIGKLKKAVQQFKVTLSGFGTQLLGERDEELGYSELMAFHGAFVNALEMIPFKGTPFASPIIQGVDQAKKAFNLYPHGNLANYLPAHRLFFDNYIEFKRSHDQSRFGAMLSLKEYGSESSSIMLDALLHLDCEFIYTNSFGVEPNDVGQKKICKQIIRLENSNDPAISQLEELEVCRDDLASSRLKVGYHHNTLMLLADDLEHLQELVNKAIKVYSDIAYVLVQETIGMEAAFWAQIPANQKYIARSSLVTSQNFVDFCPLHNYRTGYRDGNHLGSAVTIIETPSKSPLFFNFHLQGSGSSNDLTPGHTLIIGGNGSGKTVLMGFMDSQMSRYGGRSFFFDRDRSIEIYVRACEGTYSVISPKYPEQCQFNPFWLEDSPTNRAFLKKWIGQLVMREGETQLPATINSQLCDCIDYAYESLAKENRNLATATKLLPIDFERRSELNQWLRGEGVRNDGQYAYLFDHQTDCLDIQTSKVGFDLTHLLGKDKSNAVLTSVCMYLMHRIKTSLDGQRVSIYMDEAWSLLNNPYWIDRLEEDLPTFRKFNAHVVFATQSPSSIIESAVRSQIFDNGATNIFSCNNKADYDKHYQFFGITASEFDFIKHTPKELRQFLYKQDNESAICKLNLAGMEDELAVFSANTKTCEMLDKIRAEVGNNPEDWLPVFQQRRKSQENGYVE